MGDKTWAFDSRATVDYSAARAEELDSIIARSGLALSTALDAGTGVGFFAGVLANRHHLKVAAFDARQANVEEARRRFPDVDFRVLDAEGPAVAGLGRFDIVTAFGLIYHLENPVRAIRSLAEATGKLLVVESLIAPGRSLRALLIDELPGEDQALRYTALHLTESSIVKCLYLAGIPHVYALRRGAHHEQFRAGLLRRRTRTIVIGSRVPLDAAHFRPLAQRSIVLDRVYYLHGYAQWPARLAQAGYRMWKRVAGAA